MLHSQARPLSPTLSDDTENEASPRLICHSIIACVALDFGLDPVALIGPTRGAPREALARQIAMYLAHVDFALSFGSIGREFGRDRTTVAHACRVVEDGRDDRWLDVRLSTLEMVCHGALEAAREWAADRDEGRAQ